MKRMVRRTYLPAVNAYAAEIASARAALVAARPDGPVRQQEALLDTLLAGIDEIDVQLCALDDAHRGVEQIEDQQKRADAYAHEVIPLMDKLRAAVDAMETVTDRDHWPVPTYNDMLFYV